MNSKDPYVRFRAVVARQQISLSALGFDSEYPWSWKYFEQGPGDGKQFPVIRTIVFIPGLSGDADVFHKQLLYLIPRGYRVILSQFPPLYTHQDFVRGFAAFLDYVHAGPKVSLFGAGLGGFLAQIFASEKPQRVESLILCNSFSSNLDIHRKAPHNALFSWMPDFLLKRVILGNFPTGRLPGVVTDSVDFMVAQVEGLGGIDLSSRLTLNTEVYALPQDVGLSQDKITVLESMDTVSMSKALHEEFDQRYAGANHAYIKFGGDFPYLANAAEVNMFVEVHLRKLDAPVMTMDEYMSPTQDKFKGRGKGKGKQIVHETMEAMEASVPATLPVDGEGSSGGLPVEIQERDMNKTADDTQYPQKTRPPIFLDVDGEKRAEDSDGEALLEEIRSNIEALGEERRKSRVELGLEQERPAGVVDADADVDVEEDLSKDPAPLPRETNGDLTSSSPAAPEEGTEAAYGGVVEAVEGTGRDAFFDL